MHLKLPLLLILLLTSIVQLQGTEDKTVSSSSGTIAGRVTSETTGEALPGATINIKGLNLFTKSDRYGSYRITNIPAGNHTLIVSYLGYKNKTRNVSIGENKKVSVHIALSESMIDIDKVVVQEVLLGQARALNQQKQSPKIETIVSRQQMERFPDLSIADAVKRIPGISTDYRRGISNEVLIRGLPTHFHTVTMNGHRVASSDEVSRSTDASIINADMVSSIEIKKTITPDMDADATSGSMNLVTRRPVGDKKVFRVEAGSGYNYLSSSPMWTGSVTYGQKSGKLDWILNASYQNDQRAQEDIRHDWGVQDFGDGDEDVLARLTSSHYLMNRQRTGITGQLDYNINDRSILYFMGHYNHFNDYETRNETVHRIDDGTYQDADLVTGARYEKDFREQRRITNLYSINAGGKHDLSLLTMDYNVGYSYGSYEIPLREQMVFRHDNRPDYAIDISDRQFGEVEFTSDFAPNHYEMLGFRRYRRRLDHAKDQDLFTTLNISFPYQIAGNKGTIKFGGKYWSKQKENDPLHRRWTKYNGTEDLTMSMFTETTDDQIVGDRYELAGDINWDEAKSFFDHNMDQFSLDEERTRENSDPYAYQANETIIAAYALTDIHIGDLSINAGLRMEHTQNQYEGNRVIFDVDGNYETTIATESGTKTKVNLFPMVNLKYETDEKSNLRFGYTHTIIRPDFIKLTPFEIVDQNRQTITTGNPDLEPSTSTNIDLMYERFLDNIGLFSTGVFYKDMTEFIFNESTIISGGEYDGYFREMPKNGETAFIFGAEIAWQQQLKFLPGFLSDFGIYANYSYTYSEAKITVPDERRIAMPQQAPHIFNVALSYSKAGFTGQLSYSFRDTWLHSVGVEDRAPSVSQIDEVYLDRFFMKSGQLDLALSYHITPELKIYANMNNLTGETHQQYFYDPIYPYRNQFFSWWTTFGLKYEL